MAILKLQEVILKQQVDILNLPVDMVQILTKLKDMLISQCLKWQPLL